MHAIFIELVNFSRHREEYLSDKEFQAFQKMLLAEPEKGDLIQGTGGLRKVRHGDEARNKGKRGGCRVIYYWWEKHRELWLFTIYGKDVKDDLTEDEKKTLKKRLTAELEARERYLKELLEEARKKRTR
jgi:hypothetical protein